MRVVFIVDSFPNASETFIVRQMQGLLKCGHDIYIFAGSPVDRSVGTLLGVDKALLSRVRLFNAKPVNRLVRFIQALILSPVFILRAPLVFLNSLNVFRYGAEAWSLNYYFQAFAFTAVRADVTIAHFGPNGLVGARMKELGALPRRLHCFFHAYDLTSYVLRKGSDVYECLFRQCTSAIAISQKGRDRLLELGCPLAKIVLMHMGVDVGEYDLAVRNLDPAKPLRILSVARLVEKKGIAFGIRAVELLNRQGVNAEYVIIGSGPLAEELKSLAVSLELSSRIIFLGARSADVVEKEMQVADIFLLPSMVASSGDEEGIPVVLMEALVNWIPVVACDSGAVREIIIDGNTGYLVPSGDPKAICEGLAKMLKNPQAAREMSRAGRKLVEAEFNNAALIQELDGFIRH